jgi:hypothetical protein
MSLKFNTAGFKLSFNRREVVGNYIFRLDRISRNLMVSDALDPLRLVFMTEIKKIRSVSLKRIYRDIQHGYPGKSGLDDFLESLHFCFDLVDHRHPVRLPLYEKKSGRPALLHLLEGRAKNWYELLSGLLPGTGHKLAGNLMV